jgi:L-fucose isomerase-like protein
LKAADKNELQGKIDAKVAQADYDAKVAELAKADSDNLAAAKKHADDAIAALDVTDTAVANQFVTAVSETDGKISVSRSAITASQIGITNTENDAFAAATQDVQAALNELADFWAWEEL